MKRPAFFLSKPASWVFCETINYYRETRNLQWMKPVSRGNLFERSDYYILTSEDAKLVNEWRLKVMEYNSRTKQTLAEDPSLLVTVIFPFAYPLHFYMLSIENR